MLSLKTIPPTQASPNRALKTETLAKLAVAYSGLAWGLFWMPLRALETSGLDGFWGLTVFYAPAALAALPILLLRWRSAVLRGAIPLGLGLVTAAPLILYSVAVLETEVVRAMLLFYLTPVWSTLLGRIFLREKLTGARMLALGLALVGLIVILGGDGMPIPQGLGDWAALAAGFGWSVSTVLLRVHARDCSALDLTLYNFVWSAAAATVLAVLLESAPLPPMSLVTAQLWWLLPVLVAVVASGVYTSMWGAPKISPGLAGILYMTEISAGAVTAAIWSGEVFGAREAAGVILISAAGLAESLPLQFGRRGLRLRAGP